MLENKKEVIDMVFFEYDAELSISTQAAMDYYNIFSKELEKKSLDDQKVL